MLGSLYRGFLEVNQRRPLLTNACIGGISMGFGDAVAQMVLERRTEFDVRRNATLATWSSMVVAPLFLVWFRYLDRHFPARSLRSVLAKSIINQVVITIPINGGFLAWSQLFSASNDNMALRLEKVKEEIKAKLPDITFYACALWIPVNSLNFLLVPSQFRVLPTIGTMVCWNCYLSYVAYSTRQRSQTEIADSLQKHTE